MSAARTQISSFKTALDSFSIDVGYYPATSDGLSNLMTKPDHEENWHGPYLVEMPLDPWRHPYLYRYPGDKYPESFDLVSSGPDGILGTADDISN